MWVILVNEHPREKETRVGHGCRRARSQAGENFRQRGPVVVERGLFEALFVPCVTLLGCCAGNVAASAPVTVGAAGVLTFWRVVSD